MTDELLLEIVERSVRQIRAQGGPAMTAQRVGGSTGHNCENYTRDGRMCAAAAVVGKELAERWLQNRNPAGTCLTRGALHRHEWDIALTGSGITPTDDVYRLLTNLQTSHDALAAIVADGTLDEPTFVGRFVDRVNQIVLRWQPGLKIEQLPWMQEG
jgi:hypothetical protein